MVIRNLTGQAITMSNNTPPEADVKANKQ